MRFVDVVFRGLISIMGSAITIMFNTKDASVLTKDFAIRIVKTGTDNNEFILQKLQNGGTLGNFVRFDWNNKNARFECDVRANSFISQSATAPTPTLGGLYFNTNDAKWYKCVNGTTWVVTTI